MEDRIQNFESIMGKFIPTEFIDWLFEELQKQEGSDIIIQILINGEDRTRKHDKFGSEIQYNITWDSDKPNKKYLTIFNFCEFALRSYDIWNSKDGDILERIQYHEKFNVITRDRFIFNKNRYWLQNK